MGVFYERGNPVAQQGYLEGAILEEVQHREVAHDDKAQEVVLPNSSPHGQTHIDGLPKKGLINAWYTSVELMNIPEESLGLAW